MEHSDPRQAVFQPSDFFVLRTPLLPFDTFERWGEGLEAPGRASEDPGLESACEADRRRLRARLREAIALPEFRAALIVAAPDLESHLESWESDPDGKRGARAEVALVRYFTRIATRATPFGLFAGSAVGGLGPATRLAVLSRQASRPRTRLDMDYLDALARSVGRDPEVRARLRYRPNDTLYRGGGRLRYMEARREGATRTHHLVAADSSPYLEATLARARAGATIAELTEPLAHETGASAEEAEAFVHQLIEGQILVSDLAPPVTSTDAITGLTEVLREHGVNGAVRGRLESVRRRLAEQDSAGAMAGAEGYRGIMAEVPDAPEKPALPYLLQVDLMRDAELATLGPDVLAELARAVRVLHRLTPPGSSRELERFREAFEERYGTQEVPLMEALDPEIGIGLDGADARTESAPLLEGLAFPDPAPDAAARRTDRLQALMTRAGAAAGAEVPRLDLSEQDLEALETPRPAPLPDAFAVMATIAAASESALDRGDFRIAIEFAIGPSGARLMGRFCHADDQLRAAVERHLREEEALRPGVAFAEIVHLPEGRLGNVICRPPLRAYEIPFLGRSGAPAERQIPLSDLRVSVADGRIVLRSARLGREVQPRLTSAHNYRWRSLGLYRFLCGLQAQGVCDRCHWDWGALDGSPQLPRVTHGRIVIARARWRVLDSELRALAGRSGAARLRAVREWRAARRLPRTVLFAEDDNRLLVDLENVLSLESFLQLARNRPSSTLLECFPGPDELPARGPDGRYAHEVLVPFVRAAAAARPESAVTPATVARPPAGAPAPGVSVHRVFPPGSEWLFAKLYTGAATADRVLRDVVGPLLEGLRAAGAGPRWFFLRYGDPGWHLRLRIAGEAGWLRGAAAPALEQALAPWLEDRRVWRLAYDTYQREVERYGGPEGITLSEEIFQADSECALDLIGTLAGDAGLEARGLLAMRGADRVLEDFGLEEPERRAILWSMREGIARRLGVDRDFERQLDAAFRRRRPAIERLFDPDATRAGEWGPLLARLERRSERIAPAARGLEGLACAGRLAGALGAVAASHVHMQCNRLLRGAHAAQELVIYDALCRRYDSRAARRRAEG